MKRSLFLLILIALLAFAVSCSKEDLTTTADTSESTAVTAAQAPDTMPSTTQTTTAITTAKETAPETTATVTTEKPTMTNETIKAMKEAAWESYVSSLPASRATELVKNEITYLSVKGQKMKVETKVWGKMPEGGYPIFIVLHGGGSDPTGEMNESQWSGMAGRYIGNAQCPGIFVSCRAVEDTWNCHSVDAAYKFYDRIVENASIYLNGNPNKAYIVGYSAGGDGVYQIAPRMPDRFAAANMTAGHPNGISMVNTYNLPFFLQVGELDTAYSRNTETVKYGNLLDSLATTYGGGYVHDVFVHTNKEHGVVGDNARARQTVVKDLDAWLSSGGKAGVGGSENVVTHAGILMSAYERNPIPERVIWDLSTRTPSNRGILSNYWLSAPLTANSGILDISYDKATNTVRVNSCTVRGASTMKITVYLSEEMLDLFSEVHFEFNGKTTSFMPTISEDTLTKTTKERGDKNFQFVSSFTFTLGGEVKY